MPGTTPWKALRKMRHNATATPPPQSVTALACECECENESRWAYTWRGDGLLHCSQCDGLMPDQPQEGEDR